MPLSKAPKRGQIHSYNIFVAIKTKERAIELQTRPVFLKTGQQTSESGYGAFHCNLGGIQLIGLGFNWEGKTFMLSFGLVHVRAQTPADWGGSVAKKKSTDQEEKKNTMKNKTPIIFSQLFTTNNKQWSNTIFTVWSLGISRYFLCLLLLLQILLLALFSTQNVLLSMSLRESVLPFFFFWSDLLWLAGSSIFISHCKRASFQLVQTKHLS